MTENQIGPDASVNVTDDPPISNLKAAVCKPDANRTLTDAEVEQRRWAAVKKAIYASKSAAKLRRERLRPLVSRLRREFPHLRQKPAGLVYDLAEAREVKGLILLDILENGVTGGDGDSRRMVTDHARYLDQCRSLEAKLGIGAPETDPLAALLAGGGR